MSDNAAEDSWCLIESDPGVFTELLESLGCEHVELMELWSLDDESIFIDNFVYGLVFLFQWDPNQQSSHAETAETEIPEGMWFGRQVATNACATQAILSILLNATADSDTSSNLNLGKTLSEFREFTKDFSAQIKGVSIASSEELRKAHNSFALPDTLFEDGSKPKHKTEDAEAFHFVAYVPFQGTVYELDGLMPGPIAVGEIPTVDGSSNTTTPPWISVAKQAIQTRMGKLQTEKFNLMAVIQDKRVTASSEEQLMLEEEKRKMWKLENERRRHNYIPLVVQILKELAMKQPDALSTLVQQAKERKLAKLQGKNTTTTDNKDVKENPAMEE